MDITDINQQFNEYQDSLALQELHLKLLPEFDCDTDELIQLLYDLKDKPIL